MNAYTVHVVAWWAAYDSIHTLSPYLALSNSHPISCNSPFLHLSTSNPLFLFLFCVLSYLHSFSKPWPYPSITLSPVTGITQSTLCVCGPPRLVVALSYSFVSRCVPPVCCFADTRCTTLTYIPMFQCWVPAVTTNISFFSLVSLSGVLVEK